MLKRAMCLAVMFVLAVTASAGVFALSAPYESYTFDHWEEYIPAPQPYLPDAVISGAALGAGAFLRPSDIFVCPNGDIQSDPPCRGPGHHHLRGAHHGI
jgi:hypothetical protein